MSPGQFSELTVQEKVLEAHRTLDEHEPKEPPGI